jgi:hypothetical protein
LSKMVRPDNRDARMHLIVIAPGHEFRHGAAVGPARVRVADVGGEAFQELERGPLAGGGGDRGRHGVGLMVRVLASSMMGSRAVNSAGAGCCRAEQAGQRLTVFAEKGRVPRSVTVTGHVIGGDASEPPSSQTRPSGQFSQPELAKTIMAPTSIGLSPLLLCF